MDRFSQFGDRDRVNYTAFLRFVARQAAAVSAAALPAGFSPELRGGHTLAEEDARGTAVYGAGHDGLGLGGADLTLGATMGGAGWHGEAVDAAGGALPGDALADANVDHWLQTAATPADRRRFKELHGVLRKFQHEHDEDEEEGWGATAADGGGGLGQTM